MQIHSLVPWFIYSVNFGVISCKISQQISFSQSETQLFGCLPSPPTTQCKTKQTKTNQPTSFCPKNPLKELGWGEIITFQLLLSELAWSRKCACFALVYSTPFMFLCSVHQSCIRIPAKLLALQSLWARSSPGTIWLSLIEMSMAPLRTSPYVFGSA